MSFGWDVVSLDGTTSLDVQVAVQLWRWYRRVSNARHVLAVTDREVSGALPLISPSSPFHRSLRASLRPTTR